MDSNGGGGDIADSFSLTRANFAFFKAEELYNTRKSIDDPIHFTYNHQALVFYSKCPIQPEIITQEDSIIFYPLTHSFLLKEYFKENFNPNNGETILDCGGAEGIVLCFLA